MGLKAIRRVLILTIPGLIANQLTHSFSPFGLDFTSPPIRFPLPKWTAPFIYIILLTIYGIVRVQHRLWRTEQRAKALGAEIIPKVRFSWPGNLDFIWMIATTYFDKAPGEIHRPLFAKYGYVYDNWILWKTTLMTAEPELMKQMLAGPRWTNFPKGAEFREIFHDFLGTGIFNSDGDVWKHHRALTRPFFAREEISNFDVFDRHTSHLLSAIAHSAMFPNEKAGRWIPPGIVDFQELAGRFTLDTATEFLFGACIDSLSEICPPPAFVEGATSVSASQRPNASEFFRAFNNVQHNTHSRYHRPLFWKLRERYSGEVKRDMAIITPLLDSIIQKALENNKPEDAPFTESNVEDTKSQHTVFLDHLISVTRDPEAIRHELLNILLAARDTTASLLSSVVYELSQDKQLLDKLRNEIVLKFGTEETPEANDVRSLKFLRAVLNETLRMHPPVPFNVRSSVEEDVVTIGERRLYIPPNTMVGYGLILMQRRKDLWGEDANVFDPERWCDDRVQMMTRNPFIFQSFSAGPRICLGQQFAYNEASFCLVRLLQKYDHITLSPEAYPLEATFLALSQDQLKQGAEAPTVGEPMRYAPITLTFKHGLWVKFEKSEEANLSQT